MAQNTLSRYLVTYDIAHPRRLARVFRSLKKEGVPLQYSVFLVETSAVKMGQIMGRLAKLIDVNEDDVRAYRLPDNGWHISMGASILPDDMLPGGALMDRPAVTKAGPTTANQSAQSNTPKHVKDGCKLLSRIAFSSDAE